MSDDFWTIPARSGPGATRKTAAGLRFKWSPARPELDAVMAAKHHPMPLSGSDRKALTKELERARTMTTILAGRAAEAAPKARGSHPSGRQAALRIVE